MSYGVGWFGRVFGTLGMFGSVVFFCNGGMFGAGVFLVRECFWCGSVFGAGVFLVRDGPPPRNLPSPAGVLGGAPQSTKGGKKERQTTSQPKRNAYFQFKLLIINDINQYFNIHLHLIRFITYNR